MDIVVAKKLLDTENSGWMFGENPRVEGAEEGR